MQISNNIEIGTKGIVATYAAGFLFLIACLTGIYFDNYLIALSPFVLAAVLYAFYSIKHTMFLIVFLTPFSIPLSYVSEGLSFDMSLLTEPLLVILTGIFYLKLITEKRFDKKILTHPITISLYVYLGWMLVTSVASTMVLVSLKYFVSKVWLITTFYLIATQIFRERNTMRYYFWAHLVGVCVVILITVSYHAQFAFAHEQAHWVMNPFYKDHTSYGAALALLLPMLIGYMTFTGNNYSLRFIYWIFLIILSVGIIFSYTRAAWLSLAGALGVWLVVKLRINFKALIVFFVFAVLLAMPMIDSAFHRIKKNDEVSSTDFSAHIKSMSNISTDASNLERLNRWSCAYRMFLDKPVFGFGPGAYMFKYGTYQKPDERTIISTNMGDVGNAHSEYLGSLSESGLLGMFSVFGFMITTLVVAFRLVKKSQIKWVRTVALYSILSLITYYLHAFLNNFLDQDKITAMFWGYTAMIVALDVYHNNQEGEKEKV